MFKLKYTFILFIFIFQVSLCLAGPPYKCEGKNAYFIKGIITKSPIYASGKEIRHGHELSHTIFYVKDSDHGKTYQVALDNIFANDYDLTNNGKSMPPSYKSSLKKGELVDLCGATYTDPNGIHWVHTNCGVLSSGPNGFVIPNNNHGISISSNQEYCNLWPSN